MPKKVETVNLEWVKSRLKEVADFDIEGTTPGERLELVRLHLDALKVLGGLLVKREKSDETPPPDFLESREPDRGMHTRVVE